MLFNGLPIGTVPYLNAVPLTSGLEDGLVRLPPTELSRSFRARQLAAALLSITEAMLNREVVVLNGVAIACRGPVYSVILAHQDPLDEMAEVALDPASCTSDNLLKVILHMKGLAPRLIMPSDPEFPASARNLLLIGNRAIDFRRKSMTHRILDLGQAWYDLTGLPFVFAAWLLHRDLDNEMLRSSLLKARDHGLSQLDVWVRCRPEFDRHFRRRYLGGYIRYNLGLAEKRGIELFASILSKTLQRPLAPIQYTS